ncbi:hypothetical protein [Pseudohalioglobus lutimaris]|uniref:Uncharacterized protein n=1 Tax=Pseudohalioglobus lutimaris TaxID=1737061 RepID=A0A2N5X1G7_9GAMM|nr:hypothetical protein [Pseudohalioglobus lutimaris]PLW68322.1 hypothetical protein C0039_13075 [Pseudohalioglobus lutimaris]
MVRVKSFWVLGLAILLAGLMLLEGSWQFVDDLRFSTVETELGFRGREQYQPTVVTRAATTRTINKLLAARPHHPDYLAAQANDLAWQAYWSDDRAEVADLLRRAVDSQEMAVAYRPARPQDRRLLLEYQQLVAQVK